MKNFFREIIEWFKSALKKIINIIRMSASWLSNYIKSKIQQHNRKKAIFTKVESVLNEGLKQAVKEKEPISMDEFERMCEESPYIAAVYDPETDEISDIEGINASVIDANISDLINQNNGTIIFEG